MPVTDKRTHAVYVDIEDASYVAPPVEVGRTVFCAGFCDRGPHNRIVEVTSQQTFQNIFGPPNFKRTSQSHYFMNKSMEYTGRGLYVRVMPFDSTLANAIIEEVNETKVLTTGGLTTPASSGPSANAIHFEFKQLTLPELFKPLVDDEQFWIYDSTTGEKLFDEATYNTAMSEYDAYKVAYNESLQVVSIEPVDNTVVASINVGDWIFAGIQVEDIAGTMTPVDPENTDTTNESRQVIAKEVNDIDGLLYLTLDKPYDWTNDSIDSKLAELKIFTQFSEETDTDGLPWDITLDNVNINNSSIYTFFSIGTGEYYNNLILKGSRNTELEKMYTDDNGNVLFKYMFMNLALYEKKDDNTLKLIEGPWQVSLTRENPDGITNRDLNSGDLLYIEEVINSRSELIRCKAGVGDAIRNLVDPTIGEQSRLRVMLYLMGSGSVTGGNAYSVIDGLVFQGGDNGHSDYVEGSTPVLPMYKYNVLQQHSVLDGLLAQAYNGSLPSVDNSVQLIREVIYPWYNPDYIITGGTTPTVQDAARQLADYRQDAFHLADTGYKRSASDDLNSRLNQYPWNNWTSMLYTQFREIADVYTGEKIWVSPVYHAIQRHLAIDASYFVGEPVAGIEKGAISEPIKLAYSPDHTARGDLLDAELNCTIVEPQGKYFLSQMTTWKRLSILKRAHAAKFVCYCRKMIPPLLKDILERKATPYWINQAKTRVNQFLQRFTNSTVERYQILDRFDVQVSFDDVASELNVYITMKPLRVIERINVFIIVQ